jgi:plastocyanin
VVHTVTSGTSDGTVGQPDGIFDSGNIARGERFSITFGEPGEFEYYCAPHPWMKGRVIVEAT